MQLQKEELDKFEPGREVKKEKIKEKKDEKATKKKKGEVVEESEISRRKNKRLFNFNLTLLMYED